MDSLVLLEKTQIIETIHHYRPQILCPLQNDYDII